MEGWLLEARKGEAVGGEAVRSRGGETVRSRWRAGCWRQGRGRGGCGE